MENYIFAYEKETSGIISPDGSLLHYTEGSPANVDFPEDVVLQLHKMSPGIVFNLAHVHPPSFWSLSKRDELTLKTWARTLFPFPVRMSVITDIEKRFYDGYIEATEHTYVGMMESRSSWENRGKNSPREFYLKPEKVKNYIHYFNEFQTDGWYGHILLDGAYSTQPVIFDKSE